MKEDTVEVQRSPTAKYLFDFFLSLPIFCALILYLITRPLGADEDLLVTFQQDFVDQLSMTTMVGGIGYAGLIGLLLAFTAMTPFEKKVSTLWLLISFPIGCLGTGIGEFLLPNQPIDRLEIEGGAVYYLFSEENPLDRTTSFQIGTAEDSNRIYLRNRILASDRIDLRKPRAALIRLIPGSSKPELIRSADRRQILIVEGSTLFLTYEIASGQLWRGGNPFAVVGTRGEFDQKSGKRFLGSWLLEQDWPGKKNRPAIQIDHLIEGAEHPNPNVRRLVLAWIESHPKHRSLLEPTYERLRSEPSLTEPPPPESESDEDPSGK